MTILQTIAASAKAAGIAAQLLYGICSTESDLRVNITGDDGRSIGICQVQLGTARMFIPKITRKELMNPLVNTYVAGLYLAKQGRRYQTKY